MAYFETNMSILRERFPYIAEQIDNEKEEMRSEGNTVYWDVDIDGQKIIAVDKEGYLWYLNSRYHSRNMIYEWCKRHKRKHYFEPELVFGLGTGDYYFEQRNENQQNPMLIYEPDLRVFMEVLKNRDMTEVFEDEHLFLAVGTEGVTDITVWMSNVINYSNYEYIDFCALPGYISVYPYEYLLYKRAFMEMLEELILKKNTLNNHGYEMVENEFSHMEDFVHQRTLAGLIKKFQEKKEEMPEAAFLISAGPSLDKNIQDLKLIQGRAFIMAVDTAIRPLLQAGIQPDIFITIDPAKDIFLFEQEGIEKIPLIVNINVRKGVSKIHTGPHFYIVNGGDYVLKYLQQYHVPFCDGSAGGSVATDAFLFLERMGFSTIVLVGQDLAYPNNRSHAKAAYDDIVDPEKQGGVFFKVEDIYGNQVLTRTDMNHYRRWFETEIARRKNLRVIDATEGGAKIHGTEIMTLKEAIGEVCDKKYDFQTLIASVEPTFMVKEQNEIEEDLGKFHEYVRITEERLKEGRSAYEHLDKLNQGRNYESDDFKKTYQEVTEFNEWLEKDPIVDLLSSLSHREEFEVQYDAYKVKEDVYEDIHEITEQSTSLIDTYLKKISVLEDCAKNMEE